MTFDVKEYLESKGVPIKSATGSNIHTACWFCNEAEDKRGRLYINIDPTESPPGKFFCHLCGEKGAFNKIRRHFGDEPIQDDGTPFEPGQDEELSERKLELLEAAAEYYYNNLADNEQAFQYLKYERGLTFDTIESHRLGWADGTLGGYLQSLGFSLAECQSTGLVDQFGKDFLYAHITIPYVVNGNVVNIRGKDINGKYLSPAGTKTRLYNLDALWGEPSAAICEGEFDALVFEQLGFAAVGMPGANIWQDSMTAYFDELKRVNIVLDNDDAGRVGSEKIAKAFGPKARIVTTLLPETTPDDKNDISELVVNKGWTREDFEFLFVKSRGGLLVTVDDAFAEWQEVQNAQGIKLGYPMIDDQLSPGILPGQVLVTLAKSGTGKTVSMLNMFERMVALQPDIKILFVSLEQTRGDWFERAHRIHRFYELQSQFEDTLGYFRNNITIMDKNRVTEEELIQSLEQYEYEFGQKPDLVAVDYLGYWARGYAGESYERTSKAIMAMKRIAKDMRIPFITPHQLSRGTSYGEEPDIDNARDSGVIVETADFVISLWSPDQRRGATQEDREGAINMKIGKSRHGGVGTTERLQFAPYSLVMIPEFDPLYQAAKDEHFRFTIGDTYEQVISAYETGSRNLHFGEVEEEEIDIGF